MTEKRSVVYHLAYWDSQEAAWRPVESSSTREGLRVVCREHFVSFVNEVSLAHQSLERQVKAFWECHSIVECPEDNLPPEGLDFVDFELVREMSELRQESDLK